MCDCVSVCVCGSECVSVCLWGCVSSESESVYECVSVSACVWVCVSVSQQLIGVGSDSIISLGRN